MRLDKYLKVSRIIKRRTVANDACDTEHVTVNGRRAKASYDVKENDIILVLDFDFDMGYMFNECTVTDDNILVFDEHVPGEEKDLIYAYDLVGKAWIAHGDELTGRTLNGETRSVVHKDGKDIIIF